MSRREKSADGTTFITGGAGLPTGAIFMWPLPTNPPGALLCQGGTFDGTVYPELAKILGDTFGTHVGNTYYLPNFNARSPIGARGTSGTGSANNYAIGQKYGSEWMPAHNHGGVTDYNYSGSSGYNAVPTSYYSAVAFGLIEAPSYSLRVMVHSNTTEAVHRHGIPTEGAGNAGNMHPVLGIMFAIKT